MRLQRSADLHARGADGEQATADVLAGLPRDTWTVFHDPGWPGRRYAHVDHVVVGPPGVFVIDSKNWSGSVAVEQDVLRQNGKARQQAVAGVAEAAVAVGRLTSTVGPHAVHPVLCFVRDQDVSGWARDVMVCSTGNVLQMLTTRPPVLSAVQLQQVSVQLDVSLRSAVAPAPRNWTRRSGERPVPAHRAGTRPPRPRSRSKNRWVKALVALGIATVFLAFPQVINAVSHELATLFDSPARK